MIDSKVQVYCMPGMAANSAIFEYVRLDSKQFQFHYLEWKLPIKEESLESYAKRMCLEIKHKNPVLMGVSFGGILVQEMAKLIEVKKVILISSVKTKDELPKKMMFAKYTKAHKLLPTGLVNNMELLTKYAFGETVTKRLDLYNKYLSVRDKHYIDWCIDKLVGWEQATTMENLVHIHGDMDNVFPVKNIKDPITVGKGTHAMIIHRHKWFNDHLSAIILD